ncbi:MAG: PQQ-binding-like beta-propeller repeat protein [Bacteroidales bacterium]
MSNYFKRILIIPSAVLVLLVMGYLVTSCKGPVRSGDAVDLSGRITGWREDNRTGVSSETGLLKSWPDGGPSLIWANTELPAGHSSPAIGNNTIYITGIDKETDVLVALDESGELKWQTPYGRAWSASHPETRCTPTIDGDRVYVSSGYGDLACIDANSGDIIWSQAASEIHKGTYGSWGIAESVIIDGDKLYYTPGGPETMTIALDKTTGALIWKSPSLNDKPGYISPVLVDYGGMRMLINVSLGYTFAIDVSTGDLLWKVAHTPRERGGDLIKCVTPLFHDGKVYVTGGYDSEGRLIGIAEDGRSAEVLWNDHVLDVHHGGVVEIDGYIYGANWINNGDGNWCCIKWDTGEKMWEEHWNCKGSIIAADGMLYIYDEKHGNVGLVKPGPAKFDLISSFKIKLGSGPYWAHPVIHNGYLYIRHGKALMAYDIKENR